MTGSDSTPLASSSEPLGTPPKTSNARRRARSSQMEAISFRVSFWAVKNGSKERRRETRLPCPASAAAQSREATVLPSRRHCAHRGRDARPRQPGGWRMRPDGFCRDVCHSGTGNDHAKFRQSEPNLGRWLRYRPESRRLSARQGGRAALRTRLGLQFGQA